MKLKANLDEWIMDARRPVIPFFPFPVFGKKPMLEKLIRLGETDRAAAIGIRYPGRPVFATDQPVAAAPDEFSEWDLFRFIYALKAGAGCPVVLSIHYRDVIGFGVIPFSQEGHRVGLDALLVRDPALEELHFFSAELVSGGVGLATYVPAGCTAALTETLWRLATSFVYAEAGSIIAGEGPPPGAGKRYLFLEDRNCGSLPAWAGDHPSLAGIGWLSLDVPELGEAETGEGPMMMGGRRAGSAEDGDS